MNLLVLRVLLQSVVRILDFRTKEREIVVSLVECSGSDFLNFVAQSCFSLCYCYTENRFVEYIHCILPAEEVPIAVVLKCELDAPFVLYSFAERSLIACYDLWLL